MHKTQDTRPSAEGQSTVGGYSLTRIEDTSDGFRVSFTHFREFPQEDRRVAYGYERIFPVRPEDREQMEYAHECVKNWLDSQPGD